MVSKYSPGSFTKNFSWNHSYERLHEAIAHGFSSGSQPVTRDNWRSRSGIADRDRQLIPMNFFLYSNPGVTDDFILVDQLVDAAFDPYNEQFAQLALFAFHVANSGGWRNSPWIDGAVAGWANELIRTVAWLKDDWAEGSFSEEALGKFIDSRMDAQPVTKRKVLTNYRYMLESVRRDHTGLHSFLNMSLMDARRRNASAFRLRLSQSFASRLHRPSHANVRSTTHRLGKTTKPLA
jgi:hypothetical protein